MVDFQELKQRISISQVVQMLGLKMKGAGAQLRGPCPACNNGGDRALAVNTGGKYYCFADKKGGDQIALVAHIRGLSNKDAAEAIATHFSVRPAPSPAGKPVEQGSRRGGLEPLDYLDPIHEAVEALGIPPAAADQLGAGFAPKGTMRGRVLLPLRLPDGTLIGYCGIGLDLDPPFLFPSNLEERAEGKVVPIRRNG